MATTAASINALGLIVSRIDRHSAGTRRRRHHAVATAMTKRLHASASNAKNKVIVLGDISAFSLGTAGQQVLPRDQIPRAKRGGWNRRAATSVPVGSGARRARDRRVTSVHAYARPHPRPRQPAPRSTIPSAPRRQRTPRHGRMTRRGCASRLR